MRRSPPTPADEDDEPTAIENGAAAEEDSESTRAAPGDADEMTLPLQAPARRRTPSSPAKSPSDRQVARSVFGSEDEDDENSIVRTTVRPHPWRADRPGSLHRPVQPAAPPVLTEAPSVVSEAAPAPARTPSPVSVPPRAPEPREATRRERPPAAEVPVKFPPAPRPARPRSGILGMLDEAQDPGVLFVPGDASLPLELDVAVGRALEVLEAFRGIGTVTAGRNDSAEPVIVVQATHGFSEAALESVPAMVDGFPTLVVIPYELLPLKRAP